MSDEALIIRIPLRLLRELASTESNDTPHAQQKADPPGEPARAWTEPQKRLVYRLLHSLGHRGSDARAYLEKVLELRPGEQPSMMSASQLIDRLKAKSDGGSRGAA